MSWSACAKQREKYLYLLNNFRVIPNVSAGEFAIVAGFGLSWRKQQLF